MTFSITGVGPDGPKTATRKMAASAIVLAMRWETQGIQEILIASPGEKAQCFKIFQKKRITRSEIALRPL